MRLSDFDYPVSENQIAFYPLNRRDCSRLLIVNKKTGGFEDRAFRDITDYLCKGDVLVLNNTRVVPARLYGKKRSGGKVEITLVREMEDSSWEALVKGMHEGEIVLYEGVRARVSRLNGTLAQVRFVTNEHQSPTDIRAFLEKYGRMPLPPYIKRESSQADRAYYQTVFAEKKGAVAAPTASLHFTDDLLEKINRNGISIATLTLHVGYGTFKPVTANDITEHRMDSESYEIPDATAAAVNSAKSQGRRVIAAGTTVTRALEAAAADTTDCKIKSGRDSASIFIYPGYRFRIVDLLLTNFHQPRSTPMMLTSAFSGLDMLKTAYDKAQKAGYRLFSYGDAMLIL